ncbi:MAG: hypothetical protein ACOCRO_05040 [Halanaerobiales bacterium]
MKDITQTTYIGSFKKDGLEIQININSPYLSPVTLEVHEGVYVYQLEIKDEVEAQENLGEKIELIDEIPVDYLKGEWTIQERELDSKYSTKVPDLSIRIDDFIGSYQEIEIEAERFLFSGEIRIEDTIYPAYTDLDPENIFAYPISYISILKEDGSKAVFDIMVADIDKDFEIYISSDLENIFENGFYIELDSSIDYEYYETDDDKVDYLIRN